MTLFELSPFQFARRLQCAGTNKQYVIEEQMSIIRREIVSSKLIENESALLKLIAIYLCGYSIGWASFSMINLISSPRFEHKRLGYLGLSLTANYNKDLVTLILNSLKKDISSVSCHVTEVAIDGLTHVIDEIVGPNIVNEMSNLATSSNIGIKKKSLICLYLCIKKCPELKEQYFVRIINCLNENDHTVKRTSICIISELLNIVKLDEKCIECLVGLFVSTTDNIIMMKLLKIFIKLELSGKNLKLIEKRINMIYQGTGAYSLLFECMKFVCKKLLKNTKMMENTVIYLKKYLLHDDLNLQYMSLRILRDLTNIKREVVVSLKNEISEQLKSTDLTIRYEAMDLFSHLVNKGNHQSIVGLFRSLIRHETSSRQIDAEFIDKIILIIIDICSKDSYSIISNFEWYIDVLLDMISLSVQSSQNVSGYAISNELMSIALRVSDMRSYLVCNFEKILNSIKQTHILGLPTYSAIIQNMVWICAEFLLYLNDPFNFLNTLTNNWVYYLNSEAQSIIFQALLKLTAHIIVSNACEINNMLSKLILFFDSFSSVYSLQTQERALSSKIMIEFLLANQCEELFEEFGKFFQPELKMVSADAQSKVQPPPNIDLNEWISKDILPIIPEASSPPHPQQKPKVKKSVKPKSKTSTSKTKSEKTDSSNVKQAKKYPEKSYSIIPVDTGDELQQSTISTTSSTTTSTSKDTPSIKKKRVVKKVIEKSRKSKSSELPSIKIDTFIGESNMHKFKSNAELILSNENELNVDVIKQVIEKNWIFDVVDKNEYDLLIHVKELDLYILVKIEGTNIKLHMKSYAAEIPQNIVTKFEETLK